jgi:hypothetical protein
VGRAPSGSHHRSGGGPRGHPQTRRHPAPTADHLDRPRRRARLHPLDQRPADWFRAATATGTGQIIAGGQTFDVAFHEVVDGDDLAAADRGYRSKYGRYASIVDHLEQAGPRSATLRVEPA